MIDYKETKKTMEMRGIEFNNAQFSFALMIAIGIDKYDAYKIALVGDKINKIKEDKLSEFEDKCKKDCDILLEQNNIKNLLDYLKNRYDIQVNDAAMNCEEVEVTPKMLKNLLGRIIKKSSDNLDNASYSDLIRVVDQYCKQFSLGDSDDDGFQKHFINILPVFNFICDQCGHEGDQPMGVSFSCKHCGKRYIWSEEDKRYY